MPSHRLYEDGETISFLNVFPQTKGHALVIPKVHAETILDANEEILKSLLPAVQKTTEILDRTLHPDGYNIGWNHGEVGGQSVPHLHVHIMPRWKEDGGSNMHGIVNNPGDMSVEEVAALFT